MARKEFKLPDIGEGIAEGEIVSWKVKAGQAVKEEDDFVEVMTDKATVTITVPFTGVIAELRCKEGDVVPVGSVIAVIDAGLPAARSGRCPGPRRREASGRADPAADACPEGRGPGSHPAGPRRTEARGAGPVAAAAAAPFVQSSPGKVLAAPATRRRARELGIDLAAVAASGRAAASPTTTWRASAAPLRQPVRQHPQPAAPPRLAGPSRRSRSRQHLRVAPRSGCRSAACAASSPRR